MGDGAPAVRHPPVTAQCTPPPPGRQLARGKCHPPERLPDAARVVRPWVSAGGRRFEPAADPLHRGTERPQARVRRPRRTARAPLACHRRRGGGGRPTPPATRCTTAPPCGGPLGSTGSRRRAGGAEAACVGGKPPTAVPPPQASGGGRWPPRRASVTRVADRGGSQRRRKTARPSPAEAKEQGVGVAAGRTAGTGERASRRFFTLLFFAPYEPLSAGGGGGGDGAGRRRWGAAFPHWPVTLPLARAVAEAPRRPRLARCARRGALLLGAGTRWACACEFWCSFSEKRQRRRR